MVDNLNETSSPKKTATMQPTLLHKKYSLSLKTAIGLGMVIFIIGTGIGINGTLTSQSRLNQDQKSEVAKEKNNKATLFRQLKTCQNIITIDAQALSLFSEITLLSSNVISLVSDGNIPEEDIVAIEKATGKVNEISTKLSQLKDEVMPLAKECFKENT